MEGELVEKPARLFRGVFFQLLYPAAWESEIIEDIPAFYDPASGGVLQIAASRSETGFDLAREMRKFLERVGIEFQADHVASFRMPGGQECLACEFTKDDRFWMVYIIVDEDRLLIVMYNSDEFPDAELARELSDVIASIRFF